MVLLAVKKFKKGRLMALTKKDENFKNKLSDLNFPPVKFRAFPLLVGDDVPTRITDLLAEDDTKNEDLRKLSCLIYSETKSAKEKVSEKLR